jgi:hypothetical protein
MSWPIRSISFEFKFTGKFQKSEDSNVAKASTTLIATRMAIVRYEFQALPLLRGFLSSEKPIHV